MVNMYGCADEDEANLKNPGFGNHLTGLELFPVRVPPMSIYIYIYIFSQLCMFIPSVAWNVAQMDRRLIQFYFTGRVGVCILEKQALCVCVYIYIHYWSSTF